MLTSSECTETKITGIPIYFYDIKGEKYGENLELVGFVEISEKKFMKARKKENRKTTL